jgi:hypothetical protein
MEGMFYQTLDLYFRWLGRSLIFTKEKETLKKELTEIKEQVRVLNKKTKEVQEDE